MLVLTRATQLEHHASAIPADWHLGDAAATGAEEGAGAGGLGGSGSSLYHVTSMDPLFGDLSLDDLEAEASGGGDSPYGSRDGDAGAGAREREEAPLASGPSWREEAAPYLRVVRAALLVWVLLPSGMV